MFEEGWSEDDWVEVGWSEDDLYNPYALPQQTLKMRPSATKSKWLNQTETSFVLHF